MSDEPIVENTEEQPVEQPAEQPVEKTEDKPIIPEVVTPPEGAL